MENTIIVCGDSSVGKKTFKNYLNDSRIIIIKKILEIQPTVNDFKGAFIMMSTDHEYDSLEIKFYVDKLRELNIKHIILLINKFDINDNLDTSYYNKVCNLYNIYGCIILSSKTGFGMTYCMAQMNNLISKNMVQITTLEKNISNHKINPISKDIEQSISNQEINEYFYNVYRVACGMNYDLTITEIKIELGRIYFNNDAKDIRTLLNQNKELYDVMSQIQNVCIADYENKLKCVKIQEILLIYGAKHFN